jgi:hypothetical protein
MRIGPRPEPQSESKIEEKTMKDAPMKKTGKHITKGFKPIGERKCTWL